MPKTKTKIHSKITEHLSSSYRDGIDWLLDQREDARLDDVIAEINAAIGRGNVTTVMGELLDRVNWSQCDGNTLRGVVVALFASPSNLDTLSEAEETRRESLALAADRLHEQRCKCCAGRRELNKTKTAVAS